MKGFINLGCDEEAEKYGRDGRVAFDLVFRKLRHYLMTMERVPQNFGGLLHSVRTQLVPPQNTSPIQVTKNMPQLVG